MSARDDILEDLKTTLAAITAGGGYTFTIGEALRGWKNFNAIPEDKFPAAYIAGADEKRKNVTNVHFQSDMEAVVVGYVRLTAAQITAGDDALNIASLEIALDAFISDVTKAIMTDPTRSGKSRYTEITEVKTDKGAFGPVAAFEMIVKCEYRSAFTTP